MAHIPKQVIIIVALAAVLNLARIVLFGTSSLIYLLWNIFLAALPFGISMCLLALSRKHKLSTAIFIIGTFLWLLFLPNAPYIVTDLMHIGYARTVQLYYNTALLFSSALAGLVLGIYSLSHMEEVFEKKYGVKKASYLIIASMFLASFGLCLGRFLRFNSWDLFTNTGNFFRSIGNIFIYPHLYVHIFIVTGTFFILIYMTYTAWNTKNK